MRAQFACFVVAVAAVAPLEAGAQLFSGSSCPEKIEVEQHALSLPEGWEGGKATTTVSLATVEFFDGPPGERAALKHDSEDRQKRERIAFWNLAPNARGYWISCGYANTSVVVSRRLPESLKNCAVTYARRKSGAGSQPGIKNVLCR